MLLPIVVAGQTGAGSTIALLWSRGALTALAAAPFGGSLAGLCAGVAIALVRRDGPQDDAKRDVNEPGLADTSRARV